MPSAEAHSPRRFAFALASTIILVSLLGAAQAGSGHNPIPSDWMEPGRVLFENHTNTINRSKSDEREFNE